MPHPVPLNFSLLPWPCCLVFTHLIPSPRHPPPGPPLRPPIRTPGSILSSAVKMSDILEMGVSVVEDLHKDRQPLPLPAVYFLTPTSASVERLLADYGDDSEPQYSAAHVFFSSRVWLSVVRGGRGGGGGGEAHACGTCVFRVRVRWGNG
eukprot:355680-Chlamydomonas_euryale.AAC.4